MTAMRPIDNKDGTLTARDVADLLQVPMRTILNLLSTGQLRGYGDDTGWRVAEGDLRAFLRARANMSSAEWRRRLRHDFPQSLCAKGGQRPQLELVKDDTADIVPMPGHGLNVIDLRVIEFACQFLGWDLETAQSPEGETFAVLGSPAFEDVVFILTKQAQAYVLSEFPAQADGPRVYAKGSLQAVFELLPQTRAYDHSA